MEHDVIPDNKLHPPKGAATASAGEQIVSDGAGGVIWTVPEPKGADTAGLNDLLIADGAGGTAWGTAVVREVEILTAASFVNQNPTALDTIQKINFGAPQTTAEVDLSGTGDITIKVGGTYSVFILPTFGRTGGGGGVSHLYARFLVNGVQTRPSASVRIESPGDRDLVPLRIIENLNALDVITFEIYRDSAGTNDGGLTTSTPSLAGWNQVASASLFISKLESGGS